MEEREECRTKAEMEQELLSLQKQVNDLKVELTNITSDKNYWVKAWNDEYSKTKVYVKRLQTMQHTITLLAGMVGEIDITALTKEEQA